MDDSAKYLIHADIVADGVVERSDVVGAVFGQTEGLLGDELDLRDLQQTSKVGRIDVQIESEGGQSVGSMTVSSRLDKVETAILAAALETIDRVGPCESAIDVTRIEDVRRARRREVVERAKELLATAFDDSESAELVEEVRESVRVEAITQYEGLPAGPRVDGSDAIIVVEGRADVQTLLRYGVKNAIAVEGTNVPDAVAALSRERTVTAFLDGDRGGDLILRELDQVGDVDYVAFAPEGRSVEDLDRHEVLLALREKVPFEVATVGPEDDEIAAETEATAATDGSAQPAPDPTDQSGPSTPDPEPTTLRDHVEASGEARTARLLDDGLELLSEVPVDDVFETIETAESVPDTVVFDGTVTQRILDVAAQRGVGQIVAREVGELTKQPTSVRVLTLDEVGADAA